MPPNREAVPRPLQLPPFCASQGTPLPPAVDGEASPSLRACDPWGENLRCSYRAELVCAPSTPAASCSSARGQPEPSAGSHLQQCYFCSLLHPARCPVPPEGRAKAIPVLPVLRLLLQKTFQFQDFLSFPLHFILSPLLQQLQLLQFIFLLRKEENPSNPPAQEGKDERTSSACFETTCLILSFLPWQACPLGSLLSPRVPLCSRGRNLPCAISHSRAWVPTAPPPLPAGGS